LLGSLPELREPLWGLVEECVHQLDQGLAVATEELGERAHRGGLQTPDVDVRVIARSGRFISVHGIWPRLRPT
jgi:hypothetical protein